MAGLVGQQLGNYRLVQMLGEGGFAEVYLGQHVFLKSQAAIKVLHTRLGKDDQETFLSEARTLVLLKHPNIVRVLEFGIEGSTPYLVMDYAPNGTLRERQPKGQPLPLEAIVSYVRQVAEALQYAHEQKLIHRDIKPENMLVGERGEVLLSDFGIATIAQTSRSQGTHEVAGTAAYMAPEQVQGKPRPASDQYALGIVAYEWLTGERPFHGSFLEISAQHLHVPPPPLREKLPNISPMLEQVILTALAKDPHQRFSNVRAFGVAFEQASGITLPPVYPSGAVFPASAPSLSTPPQVSKSGGDLYFAQTQRTPAGPEQPPTIAMPPERTPGRLSGSWGDSGFPVSSSLDATLRERPPSPPEGAQGRLSRRTVVAAGVAGLVVLAGGGAAALALSQKRQGATTVPQPTATATPTTSQPMATAPLAQPGTTLYVYAAHSDLIKALAWSPNGQRIASASVDTTVQVWDAFTGANRAVYSRHDGIVVPVAWSPDGKYIASASDHSVQIWDAAAGNIVSEYTEHSAPVWTLAWSPDGSLIASGSGLASATVFDYTAHVWNPLTRQTQAVYTGHSGAVRWLAWSPHDNRIVSASYDHTVQVWNATTGTPITTYTGHTNEVWTVAWSPDGQRIVSAGKDTTAQIWSPDGTQLFAYYGHNRAISAVAWSPSSQHVATASADKTVQIWDGTTGTQVLTYPDHEQWVLAVVWSPDGKYLASGGYDKIVRVWQAK